MAVETEKPEPGTELSTLEREAAQMLALLESGSDDIVPVEDRTDLPASREGKEDIRPEEMMTPRLALAQGTSDQVKRENPKFIKGLTIGNLFNDVTSEVYGETVRVIPVKRRVVRIQFDANRQPIARDIQPGDDRLKFGPNGEKPLATEFYEFVVLILRPGKGPEMAVLSIKTSNKESRRAGRLFNSYINGDKHAIYTSMYDIGVGTGNGKDKDGNPTTFPVFTVKRAGKIPNTPKGEALLKFAAQWFQTLKDADPEINREPDDPTEDDGTDFDPNQLENERPLDEEFGR